MVRGVRLTIGGAVMVLVSASAVAAHATSIREAMALAYDHNPQLNAQRAATRAADEAIAQAKSGFRPTVSADARFGYARTTFNGITTRNNPYGYGITVNQNLFNGFQTTNRVEVAEARVRASRELLRQVEQTVRRSAHAEVSLG